jgi:hypothetical protein
MPQTMLDKLTNTAPSTYDDLPCIDLGHHVRFCLGKEQYTRNEMTNSISCVVCPPKRSNNEFPKVNAEWSYHGHMRAAKHIAAVRDSIIASGRKFTTLVPASPLPDPVKPPVLQQPNPEQLMPPQQMFMTQQHMPPQQQYMTPPQHCIPPQQYLMPPPNIHQHLLDVASTLVQAGNQLQALAQQMQWPTASMQHVQHVMPTQQPFRSPPSSTKRMRCSSPAQLHMANPYINQVPTIDVEADALVTQRLDSSTARGGPMYNYTSKNTDQLDSSEEEGDEDENLELTLALAMSLRQASQE